MKFFLDTANADDIRKALALGMVDGITTNPTLIAKENRDFFDVVKEIVSLDIGDISVAVSYTHRTLPTICSV